jgi:SAM-dependent methyltransferase
MTTIPAWWLANLQAYARAMDPAEALVLHGVHDERTADTELDPWYFYQDTWAFRRVLGVDPDWLLDVGSTALLVGILAQCLPVTSVDVRPLPVTLPGLTCLRGSITELPFEDDSVPMVTSLSVIEHVGLGRYGDPIDPRGSERACKELQRVLAPGGHLLLSCPIEDAPITLYNRERRLSKAQVTGWLDACDLADEHTVRGGALSVWLAEFVKGVT